MRNVPRSISLAITLFAIGLVLISCGPSPSTNNNVNEARTTAAPDKSDEDACKADISTRASDVTTRLNHWLDKDDQLKGRIYFQVVPVNNSYLEVYVAGDARGDDELEDLYQIFRKFMHRDDKKGCVRKVKFVAPGSGDMSLRLPAFEWTACEYPPNVVCPNGECGPPSCDRLTNSNANDGNGNGNSSSNSNANSNANTNAKLSNRPN